MCDFSYRVQKTSSKFVLEWRLNDFANMKSFVQPNRKTRSRYISFASIDWEFQILVRGGQSSPGWISFKIFVNDLIEKEQEILIGYTIEVKRTDGSLFMSVKDQHKFSKENCGCTVKRSAQTSPLLKDVDAMPHNGHITILWILCDLDNYVKEIPEIPSTHCLEALSQNLKDLFDSEHYSDVKIKVGEREFQSHMAILAARSSVFDSMFRHDMSEKRTHTIDIVDCRPETFHDLLAFIYAGQLEFGSCSDVLDLHKIAEKYDIKDLKDRCSTFLVRNLSPDTICDVLSFAITYDESRLIETATGYFIENIDEIISTEEWKTFSKDYHLFANELTIKGVNRLKTLLNELEGPSEEEEDDED